LASQDFVLANGLQLVDNILDHPFEAVVQEPVVMAKPKDKISSQTPLSGDAVLSELISRSQAGDTQAMEDIYHRLKTPLFNLALRYVANRAEAEDLLQEIFLKIFSHIADVQKPDTFIGWAYRIALNTCFSFLRSNNPILQKTVALSQVESAIPGISQASAALDAKKPLEKAIQTLPHKLREIFLLHDVQGYKHEEISRMLGLSIGTSKSQLFKARMKLREYLKDRRSI